MNTEKIKDALKKCELELKDIAADMVQAGDYDMVSQLINFAKTVRGMIDEVEALESKEYNLSSLQNINNILNSSEVSKAKKPHSKLSNIKKMSKKSKRDYPKFAKKGNELIKIGWSKSRKREYEHRSPKKILEILKNILEEVGTNGNTFSTENLLPLKDEYDQEIPSYQAYLCLAWLRHEGIIEQSGKGDYILREINSLQELIDSRWSLLDER